MKITNENLIRWAGLSALIAGICYVLVGILHPANLASSVTTTRWEIVHVLACAMSFFGVLGLVGLYARQALKAGWLGLAGYILLTLWMVMIAGFSFVEAFILPHVATALPALGQAWMGMFNGPRGTLDLGVLPTIWTLTAPVYIRRGPAVRNCDLPCRHPASLGGRTPCPLHRADPTRCPSPQRISAETGCAHGSCSCLARVRALLGAAHATPCTRYPRTREDRMSTKGSLIAIPSAHRRMSLR